MFADVIMAFAAGAADALSRIPEWALAILAIVGIAIVTAAIFIEEFREWLLDSIGSAGKLLVKAAREILGAVIAVVKAVHDLLVWIWGLVGPAVLLAGKLVLVGAGALYRRILLLVGECITAVDTTSAS